MKLLPKKREKAVNCLLNPGHRFDAQYLMGQYNDQIPREILKESVTNRSRFTT